MLPGRWTERLGASAAASAFRRGDRDRVRRRFDPRRVVRYDRDRDRRDERVRDRFRERYERVRRRRFRRSWNERVTV
jgi:hypothetical protein